MSLAFLSPSLSSPLKIPLALPYLTTCNSYQHHNIIVYIYV